MIPLPILRIGEPLLIFRHARQAARFIGILFGAGQSGGLRRTWANRWINHDHQ
jgi:hypothetical protein